MFVPKDIFWILKEWIVFLNKSLLSQIVSKCKVNNVPNVALNMLNIQVHMFPMLTKPYIKELIVI